jgi:peptidyl-prolyl cis-trans isomerase A (cyclophilin A)
LLAPLSASVAQQAKPSAPKDKWTQAALAGKELYATFKTSMGDIEVKLLSKQAPKTVANFVGLASGEKEWTHPVTSEKSTKPLYSGTKFHRVIPGFMIQGGDPRGDGRGTPGYEFEDEFQSGRKFDKPGLLAMANRGPNTNGSQFFITVATPSHLNGRHTIFGEVVSGYDVAVKISEVPKSPSDKPLEDVIVKSVEIHEKAPAPAKTKKKE